MKQFFFVLLLFTVISGCSRQPQSFDELVRAGKTAFVNGQYPQARTFLLKAIEEKSSDRDALYYLGMSYKQDFMMDSALFYLKRTDLLHPNDREVNLAIFRVAMQLQDWQNALRASSVLIATGDPIQDYYDQLIDLNIKVNNRPVAFVYAKKYLALDTNAANRYLVAANLAAQIDSVDHAIELMEKAIDKFGRHPQFLINEGIYYASKYDYARSEQLMREAVAIDTVDPVASKLNLANVLSKESSREKKLEAYKIYTDLQKQQLPDVFKIDSTVAALKDELHIK